MELSISLVWAYIIFGLGLFLMVGGLLVGISFPSSWKTPKRIENIASLAIAVVGVMTIVVSFIISYKETSALQTQISTQAETVYGVTIFENDADMLTDFASNHIGKTKGKDSFVAISKSFVVDDGRTLVMKIKSNGEAILLESPGETFKPLVPLSKVS